MKKLNNKGFAITGILYSLFIIFLLVLLSVLQGLQSRKAMLERSLLGIEDTYTGVKQSETVVSNTITTREAPLTGRYVFKLESNGKTYPCSSYLKKGDKIDHSITFIPKDINNYSYKFSFEETNPTNKITLTEIYSFEE